MPELRLYFSDWSRRIETMENDTSFIQNRSTAVLKIVLASTMSFTAYT